MPLTDPTCWMIRTPRRGPHLHDFVAAGMVSFGWDWDVVGDLSSQLDAEVYRDLAAAGHTKPADDIRDLRIFADRITTSDVVVLMDHAADDLLFGEVVGTYVYAAAGGIHRQTRPVRWFGRLTSSKVDDFLLAALTAGRQRIRKLPEQMHWQRLSAEVEDFLGRPADDVPVRARQASVRRGSGRTARTPATPQRTVVPDKLCSSCGLLRAPSMFPDGDDYCRDCS